MTIVTRGLFILAACPLRGRNINKNDSCLAGKELNKYYSFSSD